MRVMYHVHISTLNTNESQNTLYVVLQGGHETPTSIDFQVLEQND